MVFKCKTKFGKRREEWVGWIENITQYGSHIEINIIGRSSLQILFGQTSRGYFLCAPDFGVGCHLVKLSDKFWNLEKLIDLLGKVDGVTVFNALDVIYNETSYFKKI
jgi:hypothetical protein